MATILRPFANLLSPGPYQVPTGKLAIDWTHPLTNGLLGCWVPGVHYGVDITGQSPTLRPDTGIPSRVINKEGPGLLSNANATALYAPAPPAYTSFSTGQFSLFWRGFNLGSTGSGLGWLIGVDTAPGNYAMAVLDGDTGGGIYAAWNNGGTPLNTPSFSGGAITVAMNSWAATFVVGTTAPILGYRNGVQAASSVWGNNANPTSVNSNIVINGWPQFSPRYANAICNIACFWNRALTANEMAWLHQAPYSFLVPAEYEMPALFFPSAPASILYGHNIGANFTRKVTTIGY